MKIREFMEEWKQVRGKTYEFLETVPGERIIWSPHKDLGTFGMQMRHLGVSQRSYIAGMVSGKIDFSNKSYDKEIEKDKQKSLKFLKNLDEELIEVLKSVKGTKIIDFHDGVYGVKKVNIETVLDWLLQHECYHQGVFTCYGRLAGLGKFRLM